MWTAVRRRERVQGFLVDGRRPERSQSVISCADRRGFRFGQTTAC